MSELEKEVVKRMVIALLSENRASRAELWKALQNLGVSFFKCPDRSCATCKYREPCEEDFGFPSQEEKIHG